jgi:hypothetical protein
MKKSLVLSVFLVGCATSNHPRTVVDEGAANKPGWVANTKVSWVEADQVAFRAQYTVRGDERLNGCFQLARLDAKEALLREIAEDLRGQIDFAQEGLSESAELALTQVRSSEYSGKVIGMRFNEQFSERYVTNGVERIDCFVLAAIKKIDYDQVKRQILYKVSEADPDVKKAIKARAIKFFSDEKKADVKPAPAVTADNQE